ncbi:MAG TPA: cytochrome C oxidase subunit IV family protein [Verrucomicrobiae bacterium]|jgi:caa(3)-type oxidase subunit IV|nr:cytochrome C oxidase subunit IV family protein [Verrucomicrobiae bacterium]
MNHTPEKDLQDVKRHVRQHLIIAVGLAIGTLLTVWTSQTNFGSHALNIAITLAVASVQAFMVAGFFMHLLSEKKMIYCFLIFTAVFFIVMMFIFTWAHMPSNVVHYRI